MMRPVITGTVIACLAVAAAPWLSGGQEPLGRLVSGFALLLGVLLVWRQPQAAQLKRGPLVWAYGLLIALGGASLLWTANRYSSWLWLTEWVMTALAFKLAYAISASEVGRKWLVRAYLVTAGIFSLAAVVMYLTSQYGRLTGTFYWANPAAAYLIPAILLALEGVRRGSGQMRWWWTAAGAGFGATFLLTDSRAASAVLAVVVLLYLGFAKLSKQFWLHFLFVCVLAWGASIGVIKLSSITVAHSDKVVPGSRLNEAILGESTSGSDRLYYLKSAFEMWSKQPWLGVGAGAYGDVHPQYQGRVISASADAHNIYVQTLAELGVAGAALLAVTVGLLLVGSLRGVAARPEMLAPGLGALGLLMHFGLDIDASYPALLILVGILFGIIYTQKSARWVKPSWLAPVVAALVLVPVSSLYLSSNWADRAQAEQDGANYAQAADDYSQADHQLVFNPDYVNAEGINLYALGAGGGPDAAANLQLAVERARRAQQLDPHDAQHHQLEGRILMLEGHIAGAEAAFRQALVLDPYNHPDYALDLAQAQAAAGQTAAALSTVKSMLAQYPPAVVANRAADDTLKLELAKLRALQSQLQSVSR